jgi:DNA-directed RNA polymerase specialized sigma24 family protein
MKAEGAVSALGSQHGREFEEFFDTEFPRLVVFCLALGLTRAAAEDVAQEAFVTMLRHWKAITNPPAYVRKVAFRLAIRRPSEPPDG